MKEKVERIRIYWQQVPFFGSRIEEFSARHWYVVFLLPCALFVVFAVWLNKNESVPNSFLTLTVFLRDPYMSSLFVALLMSAIAFKAWQSTVRKTFSTAVGSGMISNSCTSVEEFLMISSRFGQLMRSPLRFVPISLAIIGALVANRDQIALTFAISTSATGLFLLRLAVGATFLGFSCAVGAVAWILIGAARWIAALSRAPALRIRPGHSDGCCGLEGLGNCCLQSAVPLLIGMILCLVWSNSLRLPGFKNYDRGWLQMIVPFSYISIVVLFVLACILVFLPVRGLHARLEAYKRVLESTFTEAFETELVNIREALANQEDGRVRAESDRLRLVQALDPTVLKLTTWPFDRASLIKYGVTPLLSLVGSFGKEALKSLM